MPYLVKTGVLAVQDFLGQSRRLRDLASGSIILTHLFRKTIERAKQKSLTPKMPAGTEHCSNIFTFRSAAGDKEELRRQMTDLETDFQENWRKLCKKAVAETKLADPNAPFFENQIEHVFTLIWAAEREEGGGYQDLFLKLQKSFEQRKLVRNFSQNESPPIATHDRCQVCSRRAAIVSAGNASRALLKRNERLCAVCLVKRLRAGVLKNTKREYFDPDLYDAMLNAKFSSTHELAAHQILQKLTTTALGFAGAQAEYEKADLPGLPDDFSEVLVEPEFEQDLADLQIKFPAGPVRDLLNQIGVYRARVRAESDPYYAIIQLDGDEMGKWLGGKHGLPKGASLEDLQRDLLDAMKDFADKQNELVDTAEGELIYAGGDDSLIFVPREKAFGLLGQLHTAFADAFGAIECNGKRPTVSGALTFVHQNYPLREALQTSREALEKWAKDPLRGGRNALAVSVILGTGAQSTYVTKWRGKSDISAAGPETVPDDLNILVAAFAKPEPGAAAAATASKTLLYELLSELPAFYRAEGSDGATMRLAAEGREMLSWELERLLFRHVKAKSDKEKERLAAQMHEALSAALTPPHLAMDQRQHFVSFLQVLSFFARTEVE